MKRLKAFAAMVAFFALSGQSISERYAEGQVWEYKTRAGDDGSLLKIQRIEAAPAASKVDLIYHISVVGFRLQNPTVVPMLAHAPVSRQTLDASVTKINNSARTFPPVEDGIAEWRQAKGGIFTISVAQIIDLLDKQVAQPVAGADRT